MLDEQFKLETLKTIAETLNESVNQQEMLQSVLKQFIQITHFEAGWIFIRKNGVLKLAADEGLPEALSVNEKAPMCSQDCYCMSRYFAGSLTKATNIIECKRLNAAIQEGQYDTNRLTHHATVPLDTPEKSYGIFNVAAPERTEYEPDELKLLESVAYQIGTALRRIEQYEREELRVRLLEELNQFVQQLRQIRGIHSFLKMIVQELMNMYPFKAVQIHIGEYEYQFGEPDVEQQTVVNIPKIDGKLLYTPQHPLTDIEHEVLQLVVSHIAITYRDFLVREKETMMARMQERASLAQDLHDSVSQLLYSIVLTAQAARYTRSAEENEEPIKDIYNLSSQALQEMRSLIAGQKPTGLEKGLLTGLVEYAEKVHLDPHIHAEGSNSIPYSIEETLYRIGQEAIHNVKKHAGVQDIYLTLKRNEQGFTLIIGDHGIGFDQERWRDFHTYGLNGMQERATLYDGRVKIKSVPQKGTTIDVFIPSPKRCEGH
ncbi:GAF domain-containing sensor histidine kinase [Salinibacillus xinjiangensis]|uniref:histidine kinase n=1 Tax=Salinibacillus xinjiangensis TaxID=1229268 RepID=A0A6G1X7S5_9BACI|nr:GAF domain-containing sensor histidine kinase [Salinibacillus xinjiangensis]MRG86858.1 GAF domain-containing protein [Salinibacillus xinjiangensis]